MAQTTGLKIGAVEIEDKEQRSQVAVPSSPVARKRKSRAKPILVLVGVVLLVALAIGGVIWSHRGLVTVQTGKVARRQILSVVTASGQIMPPPNDYAAVNANSMGKVTEILVQEGNQVKKGQLLMKTENVQQEAGVEAQQAAVITSQADYRASAAAVLADQASLKTAAANTAQAKAKYVQAKADYQRDQQLFKAQVIARQTLDQGLSDYEVAQAGVQSAEAQVAQQKALTSQAAFNRDMARARLMQSQAQLTSIQNQYEQTIYRSPMEGIITALPVHVGENVVPGIQNATGSALFTVSNLSVITAQVDVDESDIVNIKLGQPAQVSIDAIPNKTFSGKVTQIGMEAIDQNTGQPVNPNSATVGTSATDFQVLVTLDHPPTDLRPGLSCTAKVVTAMRNNVIAIPIQALTIREKSELEKESHKNSVHSTLAASTPPVSLTHMNLFSTGDKEIQGVFVVRGGVADFVPVKTGTMGTTDVEVLSGLKPDDTIVTGSYKVLRTLKNHTKIRVDNSITLGGPSSQSNS